MRPPGNTPRQAGGSGYRRARQTADALRRGADEGNQYGIGAACAQQSRHMAVKMSLKIFDTHGEASLSVIDIIVYPKNPEQKVPVY